MRRRLAILGLAPLALAAGIYVALPSERAQGSAGGTQPPSTTPAAPQELVSGEPLRAPEIVHSTNGVLRLRLVAAQTSATIAGKTVAGFLTYNGAIPAPTLAIEPGDRIELEIVNQLDEPTNLHAHGLHVRPDGIADNVLRSMPPGSTSQVSISVPADHPHGLYWYHPHLHGQVDNQVGGGLAGALLIGDPLRPFPTLRGIKQDLMELKAFQLTPDNTSLTEEVQDMTTQTLLVNGQLLPVVKMRPGEVRLWRLVNTSNDHYFSLSLPGLKLHVLARDGNTLDRLSTKDTLFLAPAQRVDVLVRADKVGTFTLEQLPFFTGFQQFERADILTLNVAGTRASSRALPARLLPLERLGGEPDSKRRLVFSIVDGSPPAFHINGKAFDGRVQQLVRLGTLQEWTLINRSDEDHPFHLHTNDFVVTKIDGRTVPVHNYRDTVLIPKNGGTVTIRFRATDFLGKAVYHCHILFHEDHGMMGVVEWVGQSGQRSTTPCPDCPPPDAHVQHHVS